MKIGNTYIISSNNNFLKPNLQITKWSLKTKYNHKGKIENPRMYRKDLKKEQS